LLFVVCSVVVHLLVCADACSLNLLALPFLTFCVVFVSCVVA
jgi:hypothetical protein